MRRSRDGVEEIRGDIRLTEPTRAASSPGADVLVHAAAALPIQESRAAIRSVNVEGTAVTFAAARRGRRPPRRARSRRPRSTACPSAHPIHEDDPLVGVGQYGESKIDAERALRGVRAARPRDGDRAAEDLHRPERLGVFEILFDWIREGRRIPILGDGANRYQLLAVEDLVDAIVRCLDAPVAGEALNVGAAAVRHRARATSRR